MRTSSARRSRTATGRPAGATSANQPSVTRPGKPASAMLGTLGNEGWRCALVIANGRSWPERTKAMLAVTFSTSTAACLPKTKVAAAPVPRLGTCDIFALVVRANCSPTKCMIEPVPAEAKSRPVAWAWDCWTRSFRLVMGDAGSTMNSMGPRYTMASVVKPFCAS